MEKIIFSYAHSVKVNECVYLAECKRDSSIYSEQSERWSVATVVVPKHRDEQTGQNDRIKEMQKPQIFLK